MAAMRIAIASTAVPEVEAVKEAWKVFASSILDDDREKVEFFQYGVPSESPTLPLGQEALMKGAQYRAETLILQLKREKAEADFYIGLQSGFDVIGSQGPRRQVFLASWVYVTDGLKGSFGHGPGVPVPGKIADPVIDRGIELAIVLDRVMSRSRWTSEEGVWGVLTRDILSGRHSFVLALIAAFAPFYNREVYRA